MEQDSRDAADLLGFAAHHHTIRFDIPYDIETICRSTGDNGDACLSRD